MEVPSGEIKQSGSLTLSTEKLQAQEEHK
jgi:hypothetical protein